MTNTSNEGKAQVNMRISDTDKQEFVNHRAGVNTPVNRSRYGLGALNLQTGQFDIDPPQLVINAGYHMTKARREWPDGGYLGDAIDLVTRSRDLLVKVYGIYEMEISETLYFLNEAAHAQVQIHAGAKADRYRIAQGAHAIGRAHNSARLVLQELGFRPITNEDFLRFGAGGGR